MTIDRIDITELKGAKIKDIFLVRGNQATYIRFLTNTGNHFDVSPDDIFDSAGNRFDTDNLNYRP